MSDKAFVAAYQMIVNYVCSSHFFISFLFYSSAPYPLFVDLYSFLCRLLTWLLSFNSSPPTYFAPTLPTLPSLLNDQLSQLFTLTILPLSHIYLYITSIINNTLYPLPYSHPSLYCTLYPNFIVFCWCFSCLRTQISFRPC